MSKNVLILTGTSDDYVNDIRFCTNTDKLNGCRMEEVFELSLPSKQRYAKKYGYDLLTLRSFKNGNTYGFDINGDVGFLRMSKTFDMLKCYDVVMWLDADAIITNAMPIEDFQMEEKTLCVSYDWSWRQSFSTGNYIVQRTKDSDELFNAFLQIGNQFTGRMMQEQEVLNSIYRQTPLRNTIKILEHNFLNAVPSFLVDTPTWKADNNRTGIISPWDKNCFIAHLTGCSNCDRIELLKTRFKEYL